MSIRINVNLPEETVRVLDRVAPEGNRSRLKAGALANACRDMAITEDWFPLEEEAWQRQQTVLPKGKK
jgi:CopG family transcriptional regulator/antitoxin EndoAI